MIRLICLVGALWISLAAANCNAQSPEKNRTPARPTTATAQPDTTADPALRHYNALVEMLLDVKMTHSQRVQLRVFADAYRFSKDARKRETFNNCLAFHDQLMAMPAAQRTAQCRQLRAVTLTEQWKIAKTGDAEAKWMLDTYYAAHPPLATGAPPLTHEIVDALIEFDYFFNVDVKGVKAPPVDSAFRAKMYREAVDRWQKLSAAQQQEVFETASKVAVQRLQWENADPEQRLLIKARVVGAGKLSADEQLRLAQIQQMQAQMNQMLSQHQTQMITSELQFMRQNQQTIMGNGTYYNQTLGRWEQHGGVVTEFH